MITRNLNGLSEDALWMRQSTSRQRSGTLFYFPSLLAILVIGATALSMVNIEAKIQATCSTNHFHRSRISKGGDAKSTCAYVTLSSLTVKTATSRERSVLAASGSFVPKNAGLEQETERIRHDATPWQDPWEIAYGL
jgi:hypothetical protein